MKKLLFITFICSSLCAYAQSEIPEDTIKNRPPVKKEQIPFSPKENKRTGLDESQPQQSLQGEQQEEINLHLPPSDYVEIPTADRLAAIFDELELPYVRTRTWTTDAIYRETPGKAAERRAEGCGAVEMECASVMAAGQFRGKEVYQFLYTADSLAGSRWERGLLGRTPESEYERYLSIALETAIRL